MLQENSKPSVNKQNTNKHIAVDAVVIKDKLNSITANLKDDNECFKQSLKDVF